MYFQKKITKLDIPSIFHFQKQIMEITDTGLFVLILLAVEGAENCSK